MDERPKAVEQANAKIELLEKTLNAWSETKPWLPLEDKKELADKVSWAVLPVFEINKVFI